MITSLDIFTDRLSKASSFDESFSLMFNAIKSLGFTSLAYTYTPVLFSHDGMPLPPNLIQSLGLPKDHDKVWIEERLFAIDAAWQASKVRSMPFMWSCKENDEPCVKLLNINQGPESRPIVDYALGTGLTLGLSLPIRSTDGSLTTITVSILHPEPDCEQSVTHSIGEFTLYALKLHEEISKWIDLSDRACPHFKLSRREIECLRLAAQGYTTEQVAGKIFRSVPTAALHLKNAAKKLGAQNRSQALARAAYYKLLNNDC